MKRFLRALITPATTATFLVVGVTGVMMFFHWGERAVKGMHEWFGVVMTVASLLHLWRNWRSLTAYLRKGPQLQIALGVAVVGVAGFLVGSLAGGAQGPSGMRAVMGAVERAPLAELAPVLETTPEALVGQLEAAGFTGVAPSASPHDIGEASGRSGREVMDALAPAAP